MPVEVSWHPDFDNVIVFVFIGKVTIKETQAGLDRVYEMRTAARVDTLHAIYDARQLTGVPEGLISNFPYFARLGYEKPYNGLSIVVGARGFGEIAMGIFSRVYQKVETVTTLEEALSLIRSANSGVE